MKTSPVFSLGVIRGAILITALGSKDLCHLAEFQAEFRRSFESGRHWQSIVRCESGGAIGTIYSYDYSERDSCCSVTLYLAEEHRSLGRGVFAALRFCHMLFDELKLFKVYFDVYESNQPVINMLIRCSLPLEVCFRHHVFINGFRRDMLRFALYRPLLEDLMSRYLRHKRSAPGDPFLLNPPPPPPASP